MSFGALAFLNPWLLAALAALPIIYWLLRTVPPRPRQVEFPPTRILVGLQSREKTPAKTPWWLMLLRLLAAALLIFALAEPVLNPTREAALKGTGPVVIAVDNGWAAAPRWSERTGMIDRFIAEAEAQNRPVALLATASPAKGHSVRIEAPADARSTAAALQPQPFAPDRLAAATALEAALAGKGEAGIVWLTDGIDHDREARAFADRLQALASRGGLSIVEDRSGTEPIAVAAGVGESGRLEAVALRSGGPAREGMLHAFSARGQRLAEAPFRFAAEETISRAAIELPLELRNQVARIEIAAERSAGAVSLLDQRSQWQRVGLISGERQEEAQPLLAPLYYVQRALAPYAEIVRAPDANLASGIESILKQGTSVLVLADIGTLTGEVKTRVQQWIERGGVLVRFAGPRLEKGGDDLLPVPLRIGGRTLGGALSWSTPQPLAPIEEQSLFAGLAVPEEVTVSRQVLADPARLGPDVAVWARLKDGTPLVTAARRGQGQIALFHVTANSDWSNLPMSGLFVEMLRRIAALGQAGAGGEATTTDAGGAASSAPNMLAPLQTLDGFGTLKQPPPTAQAIPAAALASLQPSLDHPPGYYGPAGSPRAVNIATMKTQLAPLPDLAGAERRGYESETATPLKPWLLAAALTLILLDIIAILLLQGGSLRRRVRQPQAAALMAAILLWSGLPQPARGQTPAGGATAAEYAIAQKATSKVTLAYVLTGDAATDEASRLGLSGLNKILTLRTAVEPNEPMGVDVVTQEIVFFPVLYWPVLPNARALPEEALAKVDAYMKQGGLIIFDTRDQGTSTGLAAAGPGGQALQRMLGRLDVPRLEPVPEDHVLTKAFYLLRWFPGRWDGGQLWVEADTDASDDDRKARRSDGVTSLVITSNDFASAWALDDRGRPVYPMVTGGEVQREMAFRTGVNIVMHALTGNYKADQVHIPALLERLGQ